MQRLAPLFGSKKRSRNGGGSDGASSTDGDSSTADAPFHGGPQLPSKRAGTPADARQSSLGQQQQLQPPQQQGQQGGQQGQQRQVPPLPPGAAAQAAQAAAMSQTGSVGSSGMGAAAAQESPSFVISQDYVQTLRRTLLDQTKDPRAHVLPPKSLRSLIVQAAEVLEQEPNVVEVTHNHAIHVIGDIHGQFHDLCRVLDLTGGPNERNTLVFLGDYVDRGCWGVEVLVMLLYLKVLYPKNLVMLRGNHETATCIEMYGFAGEVRAKYGASFVNAFVMLFTSLPICAVIQGKIMGVHGGLWRSGDGGDVVGTLDELRKQNRKDEDPLGTVICDALWSDPRAQDGIAFNAARGGGIAFGPDATNTFLKQEGLTLIIRAHEGPDARLARPALGPMDGGYSIDHSAPSGKLVTVFSAPDYPVFKPVALLGILGPTLGAFCTLKPPWDSIEFTQFRASPRPAGHFYQSNV
eukprot:m51a1_g1967 putative serine threonine-protein phosphatase 7 (465) ;mRNA; f:1082371-1084094